MATPLPRRRVLAALGFSLLTGCGQPAEPREEATYAASLVISPGPSLALEKSDTAVLKAVVKDNHGTPMPAAVVTWMSEDTSQVKVSEGIVTVSSGIAAATRIIATHARPGDTALVASVTVRGVIEGTVQLWPDENALIPGMQRSLTATVAKTVSEAPHFRDVGTTVVTVASWESSNPAVVTVDATGKLTAIAPGQAKITAKYAGKVDQTASAQVYVDPPEFSSLRFASVSAAMAEVRANAGKQFAIDFSFPLYVGRACGLSDEGDVYCWGAAQGWMTGHTDWCSAIVHVGIPGDAGYVWRCTDVPRKLPAPVKFTAVSVRTNRSCAISVTRQVYCWGMNNAGGLGLGTMDTTEHLPAPIAAAGDFTALSMGVRPEMQLSCALRNDRVTVCWGGQFGSTPTQVSGSSWQSIADLWPCGLTADGTIECLTPTGRSPERAWASSSTKWTSVWASEGSPCALDPGGTVHCGSLTQSPSAWAAPVPLSSQASYNPNGIFRQSNYSCGLASGGDLYCLDGGMKLFNPAGMKLKQVSGHCAIAVDGNAYCWSQSGVWSRVPGQ